jgi:hypothetical protein
MTSPNSLGGMTLSAERIIARHLASLCLVQSEKREAVWMSDAVALADKLRKAGYLTEKATT